MPADHLQRLRISDLGPTQQLGFGDQGVVYTAPNVKMQQYVSSVVYKEYKPQVLSTLNISVLAAMAEYLETLPTPEGMKIVSSCAWPYRLVENDRGEVTGYVMPAIPDLFYLDMRDASGASRAMGEFRHLLHEDSLVAMQGIPLSDRHRYKLLANAARSLQVFHQHDIAVGDLSPTKMLFSMHPHSRVFFIGCDAMRFRGGSAAKQLETPDWEIPAGEEPATPHSDMYKFGLLALRFLAGDQSTRDIRRLPPSARPEVNDVYSLISRTLGAADPADRPPPSEWQFALDALSPKSPSTPPATPLEKPVESPPTPAIPESTDPDSGPLSTGQTPQLTRPAQTSDAATPNRLQTSAPAGKRRWRRRPIALVIIVGVAALLGIGAVLGIMALRDGTSPPPTTAEAPLPTLDEEDKGEGSQTSLEDPPDDPPKTLDQENRSDPPKTPQDQPDDPPKTLDQENRSDPPKTPQDQPSATPTPSDQDKEPDATPTPSDQDKEPSATPTPSDQDEEPSTTPTPAPDDEPFPGEAPMTRIGVLLPNLARIRSEPRLDAPIVGSFAEQEGTRITVLGTHVDGWYPIEGDGLTGWIFAAFVAPSDEGIWVVRTRNRAPLQLYDRFGGRLDIANRSGSFGLATSVSGRLWEVLLPDGTTAYVRSDEVEIYE